MSIGPRPTEGPPASPHSRVAPDGAQALRSAAALAIGFVVGVVAAGVVLVLRAGGPEPLSADDRGGEALAQQPHGRIARSHRRCALIRRGEDGGSIGGASVAELSVRIGRVDRAPIAIDQGAIADHARIEGHLDGLHMAGPAAHHLLIGGIGPMAPDEARHRRPDAGQAVERLFLRPEAAAGEDRRLKSSRVAGLGVGRRTGQGEQRECKNPREDVRLSIAGVRSSENSYITMPYPDASELGV